MIVSFLSTSQVPLFPITHKGLDLGLALPLTSEKKNSFWQPGPGLVHSWARHYRGTQKCQRYHIRQSNLLLWWRKTKTRLLCNNKWIIETEILFKLNKKKKAKLPQFVTNMNNCSFFTNNCFKFTLCYFTFSLELLKRYQMIGLALLFDSINPRKS